MVENRPIAEEPAYIEKAEKTGFIEHKGENIKFFGYNTERTEAPIIVMAGGPGYTHLDLIPLKNLTRPVYFFDTLGAGESVFKDPENVDYEALCKVDRFVDEFDTVVKGLGFKEFFALGHSSGGSFLAEWMLTRKPEGVKGIILASPMLSISEAERDSKAYYESLMPGAVEFLKKFEQTPESDSDEYKELKERYDALQTQYLSKHLFGPSMDMDNLPAPLILSEETANHEIYNKMAGSLVTPSGFVDFERRDQLKNIKVPVLYTVGEFDELSQHSVTGFHEATPGSKIIVYPGSAHMPQWTDEHYVADIDQWLHSQETQDTNDGANSNAILMK